MLMKCYCSSIVANRKHTVYIIKYKSDKTVVLITLFILLG